MSEIIEFPGGKERYQRQMEEIIDETLNISNPKVRECIKKRVSETLANYQKIPSFNISISLTISESDEKKLSEALSTEYREKVSNYGIELMREICILQAELCKYEYGS